MKKIEMLHMLENKQIADRIYSMKLHSPGLCSRSMPGQFFHIRCGEDNFPLLRRPISLSYTLPGESCIVLVYRVEGQGTAYLAAQKPGSMVDVMGPLGRGFTVDDGYKKVAIVGGGMGIAPLVELAGKYRNRAKVFAGYAGSTFLIEQLQKRSHSVKVASEDGSAGYRGYVTDLLAQYLEQAAPQMVYCCGPRPMMKKVAHICRQHSIGCQVSLEERMACGVGACLGCSCAIIGEDGSREYARVCKDGPVFTGEEVCWDE